MVICALALVLAYPLREFLDQRGRIGHLREQTAEQQRRVAELRAERDRWQDPAYVRAQARERLNYVMPGETRYVVLEPAQTDRQTDRQSGGSSQPPAAGPPRPAQPWFTRLWASVQEADRPAAPARSTQPEGSR